MLLWKGILIGLSVAAPVGPIGILCIRRTLGSGVITGLATGLGAATADSVYGVLAGGGLTIVSSFLVSYQSTLRLVGGIFLALLGLKTFFTKPQEVNGVDVKSAVGSAYASSLFLTLTNPATLLSFVAIFAGAGIGAESRFGSAVELVIGVFVGSALWWVFLCGLTGLLRKRLTPHLMRRINHVSGALLLAFAVVAFCAI